MNTTSLNKNKTFQSSATSLVNSSKTVLVGNQDLTIDEVASVFRHGVQVRLTNNRDVVQGVQASCDYISNEMLNLLADSRLVCEELDGSHNYRGGDPIQDHYSLRYLPQYMGPIVDGIEQIKEQIKVEINSVTDKPLIDIENQVSYHGGNLLGQYIGVGMDHLHYYIGLLAKYLDVQIAELKILYFFTLTTIIILIIVLISS
ncbi:aromatic amino acid lyase [Nostoc sp.]|uniref:aromatic amino acid lyase n=1 Tax=Nostoc sp. TaxID=1180 RepID=UPI002FF545BD